MSRKMRRRRKGGGVFFPTGSEFLVMLGGYFGLQR